MPDDVMYKIPEVKLYLLKQNIGEPSVEPPAKKIKMEKSEGEKQPDEKEYWRVNIDRFHQHLRDQLVVQAVSKRMGAKAGEVVRTMLRLSETRSHPKDAFSAPVSRSEIYQSLQQQIKISQKELDSYLSLLADDALGLVRRTDERGGMFSVNLERTLRLLAEGVLASIVQDRFGAKSCRIFRLLLEKKYLEQKQIEELAMITARDAKEMTYKMFQEKFVLAQELPRTPDYAPSRMIYLFHVDIPQVWLVKYTTFVRKVSRLIFFSRNDSPKQMLVRMCSAIFSG
ncbi:DNA-directed RNA polymerase III subunit RPC3 [Dermacentor silvarum]|uniref:DNA-directed RNA polymerase III subunit RPC3 n=1 Tax=Dermacentor silvarum TaxID=543639 RepID=UPI00189B11AD|nr:DNA-directed RNA polymerase III subunit RPC3 [Dermacentor silvarum]